MRIKRIKRVRHLEHGELAESTDQPPLLVENVPGLLAHPGSCVCNRTFSTTNVVVWILTLTPWLNLIQRYQFYRDFSLYLESASKAELSGHVGFSSLGLGLSVYHLNSGWPEPKQAHTNAKLLPRTSWAAL